MADEDRILERVRKMLALANDEAATEGERDNALRMAHNLLMKHQLSMEDVENHAKDKDDPRGHFKGDGWSMPWCLQGAHGCREAVLLYLLRRRQDQRDVRITASLPQLHATTRIRRASACARGLIRLH